MADQRVASAAGSLVARIGRWKAAADIATLVEPGTRRVSERGPELRTGLPRFVDRVIALNEQSGRSEEVAGGAGEVSGSS